MSRISLLIRHALKYILHLLGKPDGKAHRPTIKHQGIDREKPSLHPLREAMC